MVSVDWSPSSTVVVFSCGSVGNGCSRPSHGCHCVAASFVLLVLSQLIFAQGRRKMPLKLAIVLISCGGAPAKVRVWDDTRRLWMLLSCAMGAGMLADAFGCLQSIGIVISRRHPTSTCVSRGDGLMSTSLVVPCVVFGPVFLINGSIC